MELLDQQNAERYLRETGRIAATSRVAIRELTGGVSNMVLLVEHLDNPANNFVVKQARAQLRTRHVWLSSVERIWREAEVLRICQRILAKTNACGSLKIGTPQILFEDREQYLFGMTAAPQPNVVWKADLLARHTDAAVAEAAGLLLGTLHAGSWNDAAVASTIGDRTLFDELRVDPYYRTLAAERPETSPAVERLIASLEAHPRCLVHADFSPKNMLLFSGGVMLVDFETGHYGDPAFDLGFLLSHLMLKAFLLAPRHAPYVALTESFCKAYDAVLQTAVSQEELADLWQRGVQNFAGCAWARLDGKSPVEYLSAEPRREAVRELCREILATRPTTWPDVVQLASTRLAQITLTKLELSSESEELNCRRSRR
jgi:5-methylthioribose kinase